MAILAQQFPVFQRAMRIISTISNGNPTEITTTFAHQYLDGLIVRIYIPLGYGMQQINQQSGIVKVINDTAFYVDIDSTLYEEFFYADTFPYNRQYPQVVPIAEVSSTLLTATQNVLPYQ
jgi:hypothetical protein